jgi:hypothetical protein
MAANYLRFRRDQDVKKTFELIRTPATDYLATSARNEESEIKVQLASVIVRITESRDLTLSDAARITGTDPTKICAIMHGRLKGMSVERLIRYICLLGRDVEICISSPLRRRAGKAKVVQQVTPA